MERYFIEHYLWQSFQRQCLPGTIYLASGAFELWQLIWNDHGIYSTEKQLHCQVTFLQQILWKLQKKLILTIPGRDQTRKHNPLKIQNKRVFFGAYPSKPSFLLVVCELNQTTIKSKFVRFYSFFVALIESRNSMPLASTQVCFLLKRGHWTGLAKSKCVNPAFLFCFHLNNYCHNTEAKRNVHGGDLCCLWDTQKKMYVTTHITRLLVTLLDTCLLGTIWMSH